ncbi:hypothetical protein DRT11_23950 [Salmonella enterica subsp. enterica]|nr:hypothetical protein [Salmonella enterica subsp. enterica serovar Bareilly]
MQAKKSAYFDLLHNKNYDQVIENAQFEVISILNSFALGDIPDNEKYYNIFLDAIVFIETYFSDLKQYGLIWPNELARRKLAIVLWWQKTVMIQDKEIYSIYTIFEGCTDCPRTLEKMLKLPRFTVSDPLPYVIVLNEPCEYCECVNYYIVNHLCFDCWFSNDATRHDRINGRRRDTEKNDRLRFERKGIDRGSIQTKRDRIYAKWAMRLAAEKERRKATQNAL